MEGGADEGMEGAGLVRRIARFIQLKIVVNVGLVLAAGLSYLNQPDAALRMVLMVLIADTAFIWPYWWCARRGHGLWATYASLGFSALELAMGLHLSGGFVTALSAVYVPLVLAGGWVTGSEVGPVIVAGFSTLVYVFVVGVEYLGIRPPYGAGSLDATPALTAALGLLASVWGTALISRAFLRTVRAATADLQHRVTTEQERAAENARLLSGCEETLAQQSRLLETVHELSPPVVPLMEGIVALLLIGHLDEARAHRILDDLLNEVARRRPHSVLLDLTGIGSVNQVAVDHLAQMAQGVRLLGAEVILVGVRATLAEELADLGFDTTQITMRRDIQSGMALALSQTGPVKALA
jgi:anti-anti-sigma regulatory factor